MENYTFKKKIIVFIICILFSLGLWFYVTNIENPIITQDLSKVSVEIINSNSISELGYVVQANQNPTVNLKIQGPTQTLSKISKSDFKITVDLKNIALKKGINTINAKVTESPVNVTIKNSENLSVNVLIDELIEKEFNIESGIEIIAKPYYYVAPPTFNPEKITVTGPSSSINQIAYIKAIGEENNISETTLKNYELSAYDSDNNVITGLKFSDKWAQGTIKVNEGKSVPINVKTKGTTPDGFKITSINQSKTKVIVTGPSDKLDKLESIDTKEIDISNFSKNTEVNAKLDLPNNIYVNRGDGDLLITFNIEERKEVEFNLNYKFIGLKKHFKVTPKSETIKIKVYGYEEDLKMINEETVKVEFDVSNIISEGSYSLKPTITTVNLELSKPIEVLESLEFDISKVQ